MTPDADDRLDPVARTARWTAAERARESARPDRLFSDPLAEILAGEASHPPAPATAEDEAGDSPFIAVRTRFYDDAITDAVSTRKAMTQVVLVAAGLDTRAYRLELPPALAWYELDRPELLALKEQLLTDAGAAPRCARHPVGVDLADEWTSPLITAGFDPARSTLWLVEGMIFYLDLTTAHGLLDKVTTLSAPGSELLIDTIGQSLLDSPQMQPLCDRFAQQGAPWQFGTDHPEDDLLAPHGWRATASLFSEVGNRLGRWPAPDLPRDTPGVAQSFLIHATR